MKNLSKILFIIFAVLTFAASPFAGSSCQTVLHGGIEKVPNEFFGGWRVVSHRKTTDSPVTFREKNIDIWNLSSANNVITLSNPFSGAEAQISVREVRGNYIEFVKIGKYDNKIITDKVKLEINVLIKDLLSKLNRKICNCNHFFFLFYCFNLSFFL